MKTLPGLTVLLPCSSAVLAATADEWRARSIYQVMTDRFARTDLSTTATCNTYEQKYCGGTYQGLISRLDYIQNMGFNAIWISPVIYQLQGTDNGEAYHGYWGQDIWGTNANFGSPNDLKSLSSALHDRGMFLMVDVTPDDMAYDGDAASINYGVFNPFNSQEYFHPPCDTDYENQTSVEQCWMSVKANALPDLRTEDSFVADTLNSWVSQLVSNYSIDGLRLDAANHMSKDFLSSFKQASGVFVLGEVYQGNPSYSCGYQGAIDGLTDYNMYFPLVRAFNSTSGPISPLVDMIEYNKDFCSDTSVLATFSENHDEYRFPYWTQDYALAHSVLVFTLLHDGIPIVWQGQEQHYSGVGGGAPPYNREAVWLSNYDTSAYLYNCIAVLNEIRTHAYRQDSGFLTYQQSVIYNDTSTIALRKGTDGQQLILVLSNLGSNGSQYTLNLPGTGYGNGVGLTEIISCQDQNAEDNGYVSVSMGAGQPKVFIPTDNLSGSGICGK